ncbi:hypothetical protein PoB_005721300 [Plakobranchus ocellatus]|uniref:Uncharacterized protein n=1 Tax=Plakobranchus ocellatus TaxID=259542 RepID=A0AAV4CGN5_9GAST|nr:hypothetical protein PoB_005721300 [Plakobranchus ocellatus]
MGYICESPMWYSTLAPSTQSSTTTTTTVPTTTTYRTEQTTTSYRTEQTTMNIATEQTNINTSTEQIIMSNGTISDRIEPANITEKATGTGNCDTPEDELPVMSPYTGKKLKF